MAFELPENIYNTAGELRKVGFELEFGNVPIEETAEIIRNLYGGEIAREHKFSQKVKNTSLGEFSIKMDTRLLTHQMYLKPLQKLNIDIRNINMGSYNLEEELERMLEGVVGFIVPYEINTPAVPVNQLEELEKLRRKLFEHEATGTRAFPTNIFATHINPEVPSTETKSILNYLRAFMLLYPWMLRATEVDLARRLSPYIDPFPLDYAELVLRPGYNPSLDQLIDDYHEFNPDRNRPLDLYPLFAELNEQKVAGFEDIGSVKKRPTYHFRLPNSQIEEEDWTLEKVWNNWVRIERLAHNQEKLGKLSGEYLAMKKSTFIGFGRKWAKQTEKWL